MKNSLTRSLSFYGAIAVSFVSIAVIYFFLITIYEWVNNWNAFIFFFIIIFITSFFTFNYIFNAFLREQVVTKSEAAVAVNRELSTVNQTNEIAELKKLETFRKEFLGNVSHELKTPIFGIQGYIHTLLDGAIHDNEVNVQYLKRAAASAERLSLIVDDLEAISKLESGELILDQRTFDIHDLVKDVYDSIELRAKEKNITLKFRKGSDHPFYVYADKERIRQVLVNLIMNSIKYGRAGGSTTACFYDVDETVAVEITDSGIGIEAKNLPRVFERFFRVDKSRSREAGGTGLGLAIVKHIIEAHKQTINVLSTYDVGTTFTFTLKKAK